MAHACFGGLGGRRNHVIQSVVVALCLLASASALVPAALHRRAAVTAPRMAADENAPAAAAAAAALAAAALVMGPAHAGAITSEQRNQLSYEQVRNWERASVRLGTALLFGHPIICRVASKTHARCLHTSHVEHPVAHTLPRDTIYDAGLEIRACEAQM